MSSDLFPENIYKKILIILVKSRISLYLIKMKDISCFEFVSENDKNFLLILRR